MDNPAPASASSISLSGIPTIDRETVHPILGNDHTRRERLTGQEPAPEWPEQHFRGRIPWSEEDYFRLEIRIWVVALVILPVMVVLLAAGMSIWQRVTFDETPAPPAPPPPVRVEFSTTGNGVLDVGYGIADGPQLTPDETDTKLMWTGEAPFEDATTYSITSTITEPVVPGGEGVLPPTVSCSISVDGVKVVVEEAMHTVTCTASAQQIADVRAARDRQRGDLVPGRPSGDETMEDGRPTDG